MNPIEHWIAVRREDGETVGYLEPLSEDYASMQPRTLLGHAVGEPLEYVPAEELLLERGIGELAERWTLDAGTAEEIRDLTVTELSPNGIVLANYVEAKALANGARHRIDWPDLQGRLRRA
ncbi:hypothetical protein [Gulosibacter sp. 10]|uniref:hypothetical protein n=1 Tax=Gulosibacter sp. 10 TaxID=1255570 RepID=UPI00097EDA8D|nr:hypothetical protein [Gulosibacter sp. 10]SJM59395.1 hypothetical protein FM112_06455 [Gulosibacter sp. 10]